ncbi:aryl-alcohol-oxidase from pleurotus Eryingii, partial [Mycena albidolilacea]
YDFVIVGGGTAGNVVANRLTENPDVSVLVLEAGVSNDGVLLSKVPFLLNSLLGASAYSWNYTTTPQSGLNGRSIAFPRGPFACLHTWNGMVYTRGAADDFDRYANLTGDDGWSWDRIFPYFLKHESWTAPPDKHDTLGEFNPAIHGREGPISVSLNGFPWPVFEGTVIQTTKELPDEFPFNLDMNSGQPLGVSWLQSSIGGGERSTSATGYLAPEFISRSNLHVLLHAQVSKLVNVTHPNSGKPSFGGVEFRFGSSLFVAHVSKEIILSAGAVGTPHILLNSGIGPNSTLNALGIPTVVDLPSVGQNAHDHPFFALGWAVNSTQTLESVTQNLTRAAEGLAQWNASHTGPFVDSGIATHIAWLKLPPDSPAFEVHADPSPGPGAPHLEFLLIPGGGIAGGIATPGIGNFITIGISLSSPVSRGSITINSSDPFAPPLIDPGFLNSVFDLLALRDGVTLAQRFVRAPVWDGYLGAMTPDLTGLSDAELEAYIRDNAGQSFHIVGTAAMSARGAPHGVVYPDLQVKGVAGLSVIDAAVVPIVPAAHTQAITYAFAERGADLVKQRWA